jgi:hypothetical protein
MLDQWTAETVRQMCRYIADDVRIARHCGCSVAEVQAARRHCHDTADNRIISRPIAPAPKSEIRHAACEPWTRDAKRGSAALVEALARYQGRTA